MRHVLVTGANKGIGLAIVRAILEEHEGTFVHLGSRDLVRGEDAARALLAERPAYESRLAIVPLDVTDEDSVAAAAAKIPELYGIVNNAGIAHGTLAEIVDVNVFGLHRVCTHFLPRLAPQGGRVVVVTSAAGPMFVANAQPELRRFFLDRETTWPRLKAFIDEELAKGRFADDAYGFSKACANLYTLLLAEEHPRFAINACTPGYIETDLTRPRAMAQGVSPAELGMKPPAAGARAPLHLLFAEGIGTGRYYGSDAQRSPLDRYRAPGSPPYEGP